MQPTPSLRLASLVAALATAAPAPADRDKPPAVADAGPLVKSARDGAWSQPGTWEGGRVPGAGDRVLVRAGHRVAYDLVSDAVLRGVKVAGTLSFAPDRDTRLCAGLLKVEAGEGFIEDGFNCTVHAGRPDPDGPRPVLEVGTAERPIDPKHTATIRLTYVEGMDRQSCPALVCCGGRMDLHGSPLGRTWVKLGATARAGDTAVTLAEAAGWKAGDRVVLTGTAVHDAGAGKESVAEERAVRAVDGLKVTLDRPLEHEHQGEGDFRGEAANLTRNVVVESADPKGPRGHTMFHKNSSGSLAYAEFRHLGKEGVLGRYSLHFHLCGDTLRGSEVRGCSVWDSGNRWLTVHGTNYLVIRDNVGYGCVGHGFFLEDGTEAYNVLDRNLAIGARAGRPLRGQVLPFDQNEGAGFWWANSLNAFTRNVAAECDRYGFRYEATPSSALRSLVFPILQPDGTRRDVDVRTLPFLRFEGNEVHSSHGLYGVNLGEGVNRVGPDPGHPFVVKDLKIWDVHYAFRPQAPALLVEGLRIHRAAYGVYHPNYDHHHYRDVVISQTHTEPFNRGHDDDSRQYGVLAVDGLTFDGCRSGGMPLVQISDDNPTGQAATHLRGVRTLRWTDGSRQKAVVNLGGGPRPQPRTARGVPVVLHDWYGPGRHAEVVSIRSPEYKKEPGAYRAEPPLTGDESRVREVTGATFPEPPGGPDDLPPVTVITGVRRDGGRLAVTGVSVDNREVKRVLVNGREARRLAGGAWEAVVDGPGAVRVQAHAEDAAGNVEPRPHAVLVR